MSEWTDSEGLSDDEQSKVAGSIFSRKPREVSSAPIADASICRVDKQGSSDPTRRQSVAISNDAAGHTISELSLEMRSRFVGEELDGALMHSEDSSSVIRKVVLDTEASCLAVELDPLSRVLM